MRTPRYLVASYDVFETLLVRDIGESSSAFLLLGRRLHRRKLVTVEPAAFALARRAAEQRARHRRPGRDTTLARIHEELADALGVPAATSALLQEEELALERELLHVHPGGAELVWADRAAGRRIVFMSDTYLPEAFLRELLDEHGLRQEGDGLYVSSACDGRNKRTGELFTHVVQAEQVEPRHMRHVGNHHIADVQQARAAGLRARHLPAGELTRYERRLEQEAVATSGSSSVLAGASRRARLAIRAADTTQAAIRDVAAGVAAPTLVAFTLWVLQRAERDGVQRLYFLAREGQVLSELAQRLAPAIGSELELRYLQVSRQSVNVAAMDEISETDLGWVLTNVETNTARTLLERLAIDGDAVAADLARLGLVPLGLDAVPTEPQRGALIDALVHGPLRAHLELAVELRRELATRYLAQEGLSDDVSVGLVDTTGAGSQVWALDRLRRAAGRAAPTSYLIYRKPAHGRLREVGEELRLHAWFEDQTRGIGLGLPPGRAELLELFAVADHGTVRGYRELDGRVEPVLAGYDLAAREAWGLGTLRSTLGCVVEHLRLDPELIDPAADLRGAVAGVLEQLWETPSPAEATAWGAFPFEGSSGEELVTAPLAPAYTTSDVLQAVRHGAVRDAAWFSWRAAAEARSPRPVRGALRLLRELKRMPGRARGQLARVRRAVAWRIAR